jgi:hypothetical protein
VLARLASLILRLADKEGVVTNDGVMIPTRYTHDRLGTMIGAKRVAVSRAFNLLRQTGQWRAIGGISLSRIRRPSSVSPARKGNSAAGLGLDGRLWLRTHHPYAAPGPSIRHISHILVVGKVHFGTPLNLRGSENPLSLTLDV